MYKSSVLFVRSICEYNSHTPPHSPSHIGFGYRAIKIYDLLYNQGFTIKGAQKFLKDKAKKSSIQLQNQDKKQAFIDEMRSVKDYLKDFIN